ncbi:MAG: endonuclease domain-containing protein [Nitrospirae bacterium]|nr:endonuclease domain-containing protein [Nitrospirota bacterium]
MTPAERALWYTVLTNKRCGDIRWLRQRPIDNYIVDFYCPALRLVVEIDGESHAERAEYDADRTAILEGYGLTIIRFTNDDVLHNIDSVYLALANAVEAINSPQPPSMRGEAKPGGVYCHTEAEGPGGVERGEAPVRRNLQ